jgi:hypothetical protein
MNEGSNNMGGIKIEREADIQLLKAIARTGFITKDLLHLPGINPKRLAQHIKSENIIDKGIYLIYGQMVRVYGLTEKAKRRMRSEFLIDIYKSDATQLEHDYVLAKIYLHLKLEEKESWVTETGLMERYKECVKTTDGLYITSEGQKIGVEVVTDSYSADEIEQKKEFIRKYCDDYIMVHTHKELEFEL